MGMSRDAVAEIQMLLGPLTEIVDDSNKDNACFVIDHPSAGKVREVGIRRIR
jgi:hypothetical protein